MNFLITPASINTVLKETWVLHWITFEGCYAINKETKPKISYIQWGAILMMKIILEKKEEKSDEFNCNEIKVK